MPRKSKGVLAVLTAADMKAAGLATAGKHPPLPGRGGKALVQPFRPVLAGERVLYVGEAVAMVVAETVAQAQDAADLVAVEYEQTPAVVDPREAIKPGAPQIHPDAPGNIAVDWPGMVDSADNEREVDAIIKGAAHVARVTVVNQRLIVASMETRGANASYDPKTDSYYLRVCSQSAGVVRNQTAPILGLANDKLKVVTEDVGGAFGMKTPVYPEYPAVLVAAKKVGRPVAWMSTRSEAFQTDTPGRDTVTETELALDESGKFLALRMKHLCGQGAYVSPAGIGINTNNPARCLPGMYRIPKIDFSTRCCFHQHGADGPVSRRRASGSQLRARPRGRRGRPHHRHRQRAAAQEESHPAVGDALQNRRHHHLRQRRFSRRFRKGDGVVRIRQLQQAQARVGEAQEAARHRHILHAGARRRAADRRRHAAIPRRRYAGAGAQRAIDRTGARDRVRPRARRTPRHRPQARSCTSTATRRSRFPASHRSAHARPWRRATPSSTPPR